MPITVRNFLRRELFWSVFLLSILYEQPHLIYFYLFCKFHQRNGVKLLSSSNSGQFFANDILTRYSGRLSYVIMEFHRILTAHQLEIKSQHTNTDYLVERQTSTGETKSELISYMKNNPSLTGCALNSKYIAYVFAFIFIPVVSSVLLYVVQEKNIHKLFILPPLTSAID